MKPITFVGGALDELRDFPVNARREAGYQLDRVQRGLEPDDWKPMTGVGPGVREIRVRDTMGAFRVIYVAALTDAVYVLRAFQKKTSANREAGSGDCRDAPAAGWRGESRMTDEPVHTFASVWDALEETPDEAANMRLRSQLAIAVRAAVESWGMTQARSASRLGVTQPRLNDLLRGRTDRFSLDALIGLADRAGLAVRMEITHDAA